MKLDMDLVRKILIEVEERTDGSNSVDGRSLLPDVDWDVMLYHLTLLGPKEANWIDARFGGGRNVGILRLTWAGHEFLAAARKDGVWNEAQEVVKDKVGTVPLAVFQALLIDAAKRWVGLD